MLWTFFAIALPITLGAVVCTILHYASPKVLQHVRIVVTYAWFVNVSIVILTPVDVWTAICLGNGQPASVCGSTLPIGVMWSFAYWSAYFLTWLIIPIMQGYEDSGDFTVKERLRSSIRGNLILIGAVGSLAVIGVIILLATKRMSWDTIVKLAIGASNAFALVTGALLLGFGLVEIPRGIWRHAELAERQRWLSHRVAKTAHKLDQAHQELSNVIVIVQATSLQMTRKDPLRPMMDIINTMAEEDSSFKPSGGQIGENDMDYDTDLRTMAALRRRLRNAQDNYSRYKTEYCAVVWEAMELEDTLYNSTCPNGRMFVSSLRPQRVGGLAPLLDVAEWWWRCFFWGGVARTISLILGLTSVAILFAEATLLWSAETVDLSLFSRLVTAVGMQAEMVQLFVFLPLVYLCVCTYFSLFKLGMFSFYYLQPHHTNSISLLMNCSMVSRYAAPMCYNFLRLIHLNHYDPKTRRMIPLHTVFEKSMRGLPDYFERIYPLCIILASILIFVNVHQRAAKVLGSAWRRFKFETDDDIDEHGPLSSSANNLLTIPNSPVQCSPAGIAILKKERVHLGQGHGLAENVLPLARNFTAIELETGMLEGSPEHGPINGAMPHSAFTLISDYSSPKLGSMNGFNAAQLGAGLTRRGSPTKPPQAVPPEMLGEEDQERSASEPTRQIMASLYETLLRAASGFREPAKVDGAGGGQHTLLKNTDDGPGGGSQPNSAPGSPELGRSHAWMQHTSSSETNLLSLGKKSASAGWQKREPLFLDGDAKKENQLPVHVSPLRSSMKTEENDPHREMIPSVVVRSVGNPTLQAGMGTGGEDLGRSASRGTGGWGSAVRLRWRELADSFRTGRFEDVLRNATSHLTVGGASPLARDAEEAPSSPSTPPRPTLPTLENNFQAMNTRRQREGYASEDDDEFQRYVTERNAHARPFF